MAGTISSSQSKQTRPSNTGLRATWKPEKKAFPIRRWVAWSLSAVDPERRCGCREAAAETFIMRGFERFRPESGHLRWRSLAVRWYDQPQLRRHALDHASDKIWIGNDHGGYQLKQHILEYLESKNIGAHDAGSASEVIV